MLALRHGQARIGRIISHSCTYHGTFRAVRAGKWLFSAVLRLNTSGGEPPCHLDIAQTENITTQLEIDATSPSCVKWQSPAPDSPAPSFRPSRRQKLCAASTPFLPSCAEQKDSRALESPCSSLLTCLQAGGESRPAGFPTMTGASTTIAPAHIFKPWRPCTVRALKFSSVSPLSPGYI